MKDPVIDVVKQTRLKIEREYVEKGMSYADHILAMLQVRKIA